MRNKLKIPVLLFLIFGSICIIVDYKLSTYGKGNVIFKTKQLPCRFETYLDRYEGFMILGEGFMHTVTKNEMFYDDYSKDSVYVKKINKYAYNDYEILVQILDKNNKEQIIKLVCVDNSLDYPKYKEIIINESNNSNNIKNAKWINVADFQKSADIWMIIYFLTGIGVFISTICILFLLLKTVTKLIQRTISKTHKE